ncbi:hypothetical protein [Roseicyclus mahoneyensis]|uniref:hypothetical protein n=1 Tax=Roseicyclus mahoneyensis TaxID=164332 RepID=UPI0011B227E6|nr:hypothetical protein [Roseicyclus mahoneyensis]
MCLLAALIALCTAPAVGQSDPAREMLLRMDPPDAALRYTVIGRETALMPWDIESIDLSESGGITDIFIRLAPEAAATLAAMTELASGSRMVVRICGHVLRDTDVTEANPTGTLYLPNTTAARGEAVRALWQGRTRCDRLAPEVFADGN